MKLVLIEKDGTQTDIQVGSQFYHEGDDMEVTYMPVPHKASSGGKVTCCVVNDTDSSREFFASVWGMKWIEREDQGWVHPEVELTNVCAMYEEMYDDSIIGLDLVSVIDMISQVDLEHLQHHPEFIKPMKEWLKKNRIPASLKKQSS